MLAFSQYKLKLIFIFTLKAKTMISVYAIEYYEQ